MALPDNHERRLTIAQSIARSLAFAGQKLAGQLNDISRNRSDRVTAAESLGALGPVAADQASRVQQGLPDADGEIRSAAKGAVRQLERSEKTNSRFWRTRSSTGFGNHGYATKDRFRATAAFRSTAQQAGSLEAALSRNASDGAFARRSGAGSSSRQPVRVSQQNPSILTQEATARLNALKESLQGSRPAQKEALRSLSRPGPNEKPTNQLVLAKLVHLLHACLWNMDTIIRLLAAEALGKADKDTGLKSGDHLARVMEKDVEDRVRRSAGLALAQLGSAVIRQQAAALGRVLLEAEDAQLRRIVANAFESLGFEAGDYMDILVEALDDKDEVVRQVVSKLCSRLGEAAANHLGHRLSDNEANIRKTAAQSLGVLGAGASRHRHAMGKLLHDKDDEVSFAAEQALRHMLPKRDGSYRASARAQQAERQADSRVNASLRRLGKLLN